jgi:hypothetical protein
MSEFIEVARLEQVPPGTGTTLTVARQAGRGLQCQRNGLCDRRWLPAPWFLARQRPLTTGFRKVQEPLSLYAMTSGLGD